MKAPAGRRSGVTAPADSGETAAPRRPNHYRNGRVFELKVRAELAANGYWVMGSPGSKTKVDVLAAKSGQILLVQCKKSGALGTAEWNALLDILPDFPPGTIPILAVGGRGQRYWQLTGRKTQRGKRPMTPFVIDLAA